MICQIFKDSFRLYIWQPGITFWFSEQQILFSEKMYQNNKEW